MYSVGAGIKPGRRSVEMSRSERMLIAAGRCFCLAFCVGTWWLAWERPVMVAEMYLALGCAVLIVTVLRAWDRL